MLVFVYGTLLRGEPNHALLVNTPWPAFISTAKMQGLELVVTHGAFPYCVVTDNADHIVEGELYDVDPRTLDRLDALEGVPSHYTRATRRVHMPDGSRHDAFVYVIHSRPERARAIGTSWIRWTRRGGR